MPELADIFRRYGPEYRAKFGGKMLPSHLRAMEDIENCRTEFMGGHVYRCEDCGELHYSYHSCQNRHCPKCMNDRAELWLEKQKELLLPTHYFLVTFTLPEELRGIARSNQKTVYDILFRTSAAALKELAADPRFVGGQIGMMGILHTWARDSSYHVHTHYIVPGGGLSLDHTKWLPSAKDFLVRVEPLSNIFRAKFRDELKKTSLFNDVSPDVWKKDWVVHSEAVGNGEHALKYLAPYVYRVAFCNSRILKVEDDKVTFQYQESGSKKWRQITLPAMEFIRRFLQHVLPKGFIKIRYYGFLSSTQRETFEKIRYLLAAIIALTLNPLDNSAANAKADPDESNELRCPHCGGQLILYKIIRRYKRGPP
jgi:predicted RNA-binding Zn-ribbon protein involved in translation (DUF1610 family)